MSWQGNECFVGIIEYRRQDCDSCMIDALESISEVYDTHGDGWYLLGNLYSDEVEDDYDPFELYADGKSGSGWLPNPFMQPGVVAMRVSRVVDLLMLAFECWDSYFDCIAYAGDGDEPLERVTVYGKTYDMR